MKPFDTKKKIIAKATDLFYGYGYDKASIRDIVKAVGVTNSTVYIHFKNKDDILYSIVENIGSTLLRELQTAIETHDDPIECLRNMIFRQVCLIRAKRKEIKIYIEEQYKLSANLKKKSIAQQHQIYDIYFNKFSEIIDKGLIKDIDQTVMTFSIFGMMNWAYRWFKNKKRLTIEEVAEHVTRIFFTGIFKENILGDSKSVKSNKKIQ